MDFFIVFHTTPLRRLATKVLRRLLEIVHIQPFALRATAQLKSALLSFLFLSLASISSLQSQTLLIDSSYSDSGIPRATYWEYDDELRLIKESVSRTPGGIRSFKNTYTYYPDGKLDTNVVYCGICDDTIPDRIHKYTYYPNGQLAVDSFFYYDYSSQIFINRVTIDYSYLPSGKLEKRVCSGRGCYSGVLEHYFFDEEEKVIKIISDDTGYQFFEYDSLNRLTSFSRGEYRRFNGTYGVVLSWKHENKYVGSAEFPDTLNSYLVEIDSATFSPIYKLTSQTYFEYYPGGLVKKKTSRFVGIDGIGWRAPYSQNDYRYDQDNRQTFFALGSYDPITNSYTPSLKDSSEYNSLGERIYYEKSWWSQVGQYWYGDEKSTLEYTLDSLRKIGRGYSWDGNKYNLWATGTSYFSYHIIVPEEDRVKQQQEILPKVPDYIPTANPGFYVANPLQLPAVISMKGLPSSRTYSLIVKDGFGRIIVDQRKQGGEGFILPQSISSGIYFFQLLEKGQMIYSNKILIR